MRTFFHFLKSKTFFKHLGIALVVVAAVLWIAFKCLDSYTKHGETIDVPDMVGMSINDLDALVSEKKLRYEIIDSIYDKKAKKGVVVRQDPDKGIKVKENRTIYLYVTAVLPPKVPMPKLQDKSLRQAVAIIETYDLRLGKTTFKADQCANCVLEQKVKGKKIDPGTMIEKNTVIDLVIGKGLSDEQVGVPNVLGLTLREAQAALAEAGLNEGAVSFDGAPDSLRARVYRQYPFASKESSVNVGRSVDLFLTTNKDKIPTGRDTTNVE